MPGRAARGFLATILLPFVVACGLEDRARLAGVSSEKIDDGYVVYASGSTGILTGGFEAERAATDAKAFAECGRAALTNGKGFFAIVRQSQYAMRGVYRGVTSLPFPEVSYIIALYSSPDEATAGARLYDARKAAAGEGLASAMVR